MAFDMQTWREQLEIQLLGWMPRWEMAQAAGVNSLYAYLSTMALWPLVEAAQKGELFAMMMALGSVAGSVGGNLIANQIQVWKDRADDINNEIRIAEWIATNVPTQPELRQSLDAILVNLDAVSQAQSHLATTKQQWFADTLRAELARLGNLTKYAAILRGSGAIAQGKGVVAAGARGVAVGGNISDSTIVTGDGNVFYSRVKSGKTAEIAADDIDLDQLLRVITTRFSRDDLVTLSFTLGVDYDNLPGEPKESKARGLIMYFQRRERLNDLVNAVREHRPDISLNDIKRKSS